MKPKTTIMKKTREEKINILKQISQPKTGKSKWEKIAEWNEAHADTLEDQVRIATRILQTLQVKNMTQKELAEKLEVSPQALTRIVKGRQNLTLQTIRKIEKALNITLVTVHDQDTSSITEKVKFVSVRIHYSNRQQFSLGQGETSDSAFIGSQNRNILDTEISHAS